MDSNTLVERLGYLAQVEDMTAAHYSPEIPNPFRAARETITRLQSDLAAMTAERDRMRDALKRIGATYEVMDSETDDGEVGVKTELDEWEMSNLARQALSGDTNG